MKSPTLTTIEGQPRNDETLTRLMVELYRDELRYVLDDARKGKWHRWENGRWRPKIDGVEVRAAWKATVRLREAVAESRDERIGRWAVSAGNEPRLRAMAKLAASAPEFAVERLRMDVNTQLLAVGNGTTLELDELSIRDARPGDLITRGSDIPYERGAQCPTWRGFLADVFKPHGDEMIAYVQRACGYLLQGANPEQQFFVLIGQGRNGKGVLVRTLHKIMGTLAMDADFSTFCGKGADAGTPRPDLVRLAGARLVTVGEGRKSESLNSGLVKKVTGDDDVTVRDLYASEITYRPQFSLMFHTNALPETDATDDAFWARAQVIPFDVSFAPGVPALHHMPADHTLEPRIAEELPGILAWAVEGLRQWQERGLDPPDAVRKATQQQRDEDDPFAMFVAEEAADLPAAGDKIKKSDVRRKYEKWCRENNVFPVPSPQMIGRLAQRHGFDSTSDRNYTRSGSVQGNSDPAPF
jgi:putative DNA primase/helicase